MSIRHTTAPPEVGAGSGINRGIWAADTDYAVNDIFVASGVTYYVTAAFTSGATFDAEENVAVLPASGGIPVGEKGADNGVATLNSEGLLSPTQRPSVEASQPFDRIFSIDGDLTISEGRPWRPPYAGTIEQVRAELLAPAPTGQAVIFNIKKNGAAMFTTPAARPKVDAGALFGAVAVPDTKAFAAGDALVPVIEQIGSAPSAGSIDPVTGGFTFQTEQATVSSYDIVRAGVAQSGDFAFLAVMSRSVTATLATHPGWTLLGSVGPTSNRVLHFLYRVHDSDPGPWTFTFNVATTVMAFRALYRGVDPADPFDVFSQTALVASATGIAPAALTTTESGLTVVEMAVLSASKAASLPSGYTARQGFNGTGGSSVQFHVADKVQAAAGAADTNTFDLSSSGTHSVGRVALRPVAGGTTEPGSDLQVTIAGLRS